MKRLKPYTDPRMVSARIERSDVEKFEALIAQQPVVTLQSFMQYTFRLFISGGIRVDDGRFTIAQ